MPRIESAAGSPSRALHASHPGLAPFLRINARPRIIPSSRPVSTGHHDGPRDARHASMSRRTTRSRPRLARWSASITICCRSHEPPALSGRAQPAPRDRADAPVGAATGTAGRSGRPGPRRPSSNVADQSASTSGRGTLSAVRIFLPALSTTPALAPRLRGWSVSRGLKQHSAWAVLS